MRGTLDGRNARKQNRLWTAAARLASAPATSQWCSTSDDRRGGGRAPSENKIRDSGVAGRACVGGARGPSERRRPGARGAVRRAERGRSSRHARATPAIPQSHGGMCRRAFTEPRSALFSICLLKKNIYIHVYSYDNMEINYCFSCFYGFQLCVNINVLVLGQMIYRSRGIGIMDTSAIVSQPLDAPIAYGETRRYFRTPEGRSARGIDVLRQRGWNDPGVPSSAPGRRSSAPPPAARPIGRLASSHRAARVAGSETPGPSGATTFEGSA